MSILMWAGHYVQCAGNKEQEKALPMLPLPTGTHTLFTSLCPPQSEINVLVGISAGCCGIL